MIINVREVEVGDRYLEGSDRWMVKAVEDRGETVALLLAINAKDRGRWWEYDADADVEVEGED